jgi:hypothetical protein
VSDDTAEERLTHHVRLVLDNDEALHLGRRALVQRWLEDQQKCLRCDGRGWRWSPWSGATKTHTCAYCDGTGLRASISKLAERLKDFAEGVCAWAFPRLFEGSTLTLEVFSTALAYVDWDALAESYAEDEREMLAQEAAV